MQKNKTPKETLTTLTNLVLPSEANLLGNMFGGELLARMDRVSSIAARIHSESFQVVTASVNHVSFSKAIPSGSIVKIQAKVSRAFSTSMEVYVDVWVIDIMNQKTIKTNDGIYTFVAVDENNKPTEVPPITPETDLEIERFNGALRRKQLSLLLAGRMEPKDATELKAFFNK